MTLLLGIDAAWSSENSSGVALVATGFGKPALLRAAPSFEDFVRGNGPAAWGRKPQSRTSLREVLDVARELGGGIVTIIAADIPLGLTPVRSRRGCDNEVSKTFGARGCGTHSPNEHWPGSVSDSFLREAEAAGFALQTATTRRSVGRALLEVYPHLALLELFGAEFRLPYKLAARRKNWPDSSPAERLDRLMAEWRRIVAALQDKIAMQLDIDCSGKPLRAWKAWEDVIDAVLCCWVGLEWLAGRAVAYGDADSAIWAPAPRQDLTGLGALHRLG